MKKLIILVLGFVLIINGLQAQCWSFPDLPTYNVSGIVTNTNYQTGVKLVGDAFLSSSVNFNGQPNILDGSFTVDLPINLNNKANLYVNGSAEFKHLHFTGGDTLFVSGAESVIINKLVSNNSEEHSRNVIMLASGSSIVYNNQSYTIGQTIKTQGNSTNEVDVIGCGSALPIKFGKIAIVGSKLSWSMGDQSGIDHFDIQGSNSTEFHYVKSIPPSHKQKYSISIISFLTFGILFLPLVGGKRNKLGGIICGVLILGFIACSKADINPSNAHYKLWRVAAITNVGDTIYSPVTHK